MSEPVSIDEFLEMEKAGGPDASPTPSDNALKLLVIVSSGPEEQNAAEWMADEVTEVLKSQQVEVAKYALPKLKIHPCVGCYGGGGRQCMHPCDRNDIESDIYRPDDQMVLLYDQLIASDMLLFAADVRCGGLNHYAQKFLERLNPFVNQARVGKPLIAKKAAAVVVAGDGGSVLAGHAMAALTTVGFGFPRAGAKSWHVPHAAGAEATKTAYEKSRDIHTGLEQLAHDLVDYARALKGE